MGSSVRLMTSEHAVTRTLFQKTLPGLSAGGWGVPGSCNAGLVTRIRMPLSDGLFTQRGELAGLFTVILMYF